MQTRCTSRVRRTWRALLLAGGAIVSTLAAAPAGAQDGSTARYASGGAGGYLPLEVVREGKVKMPPALARRVSVQRSGALLQQVLLDVATQAGLGLSYGEDVARANTVVSLDVRDKPAAEALAAAVRGTRWQVLVTAAGQVTVIAAERRQTGIITGAVTDSASGQPLAGVTVFTLNAPYRALTGDDGRYRIVNVPPGTYSLTARRIGYGQGTQSVAVAADQTVTADFALTVSASQLEQVVVIGYGTTSRRDLTGSVASVSAEDISRQPVPSVDQALLGRAAGVQVTTSSGQPGVGAAVRIRGGNSIGASNEPLYVIDGVPVTTNMNEASTGSVYSQGQRGTNPIAALNPNDIESIDVLKDASATAIYGARAANGVILVTTKRGRPGQTSIGLSSFYGQQEVRRTLPLLNAQQFARFVNEAYVNGEDDPPFTEAEIGALGAGTDWQDAIFRTAPMASYQLSVSGGDADTRYYLSGDVLQTDGVVIGSDFDRKSFRLNFDQTLSRRFRIGNNLTYSRTESHIMPNAGAGSDASSIVLNALTAPPTIPVRTASGEYFIGTNPISGRAFNNPVAAALGITNEERQNRVIGNGYAEFDLLRGLTLRSTLGIDFFDSVQDFYSPVTTVPGSLTNGQGRRGQAQTTVWLNENTVTYNPTLGDDHDLTLLGGLSLQRSRGDWVSAEGRQFQTDRLRQNGLGTAGTFFNINTAAPNWSLLSYLSRANYGFRDRYLATLTGRVDGSSRFGSENRYAFFPSAALAWRASEEDFVKGLGVFDDLKLRVGFGRTGNQDIGNYRSLATLGNANYVFGDVRSIGFGPNNIANPDLKWETTNQTDVGVDFSVLRNRVAVTADFYEKKTNDLLLDVAIPGTSGFGSSLQNIGSVRNRGFELAINTVNLAGVLGWDTQFNIAWNRNKVLDLGPDTQLFPGGVGAGANQDPTIVRVGEPINSFYGFIFAGLDTAGQPVYEDVNGDGEVTPDDKIIIGNAQPNYTGGITNRLTFRNFELSVLMQFSVGNKIYNINRAILTDAAGTSNQLTDVLNSETGGIPRPKTGNTFETTPSTLFVEDGTYLRGKNIRLAYTFPTDLLSRLPAGRMSSLQVYVSAQNFFTRTDYTGFDPEISEYGGSNLQQGFDFGTYPQTKQFTIGFNAGI